MKLLFSFTVLSGSAADSDVRHTTLFTYCSIKLSGCRQHTHAHTHATHTHVQAHALTHGCDVIGVFLCNLD